MAGIDFPLWYQLKTNIVTALQEIAAEETIIDSGRNFDVAKDRWRPWIEEQQNVALVNVMVQTVGQESERSANRRNGLDNITVNIDMYALGEAGEILPADQIAAERLDLLVAQVREGVTRLDLNDFGFPPDPTYGHIIDRNQNFSLTYFDQESEQTTGQYAPARWTFSVFMPFIPKDLRQFPGLDPGEYPELTEVNVSVKDDSLEQFALRFDYTP